MANGFALGVLFFLFVRITQEALERLGEWGPVWTVLFYPAGFLGGVGGLLLFEELPPHLLGPG